MTEPDDREVLLEAIAMGDLAADDERVRARASADPEFARELERTLAVQASLDDIGGLVRSGGGAPGGEVPGLAAARTLLDDLRSRDLGREPKPAPAAARPHAARWAVLGSLAAAALVLLFWRPWAPAGDLEPQPRVVLGAGLSEMSPSGRVKSIDAFRWTCAQGELFDVEVRDLATNDLLDRDTELVQTSWTPEAVRTGEWPAGWPDTLKWQVTAYDATGAFVDSRIAEVERSRD